MNANVPKSFLSVFEKDFNKNVFKKKCFFQIEEKNVYMQRQSVLKEIETVRNRETELKMRMEAFEK